MRRLLLLILFPILSALPIIADDLRITGGKYFDLETVRPNPGILIRAGRIHAIGNLAPAKKRLT